MILTDEQELLVNDIVKWYKYSSEQVFQYSGGPGRGKSVVMGEAIRRIGLRQEEIAPMAYVGAAAIVMRTKGLYNAKTVHSTLFHPVETFIKDKNGNIVMDNYLNRPKTTLAFEPNELYGVKLMAIDEGTQIPLSMRHEIDSRGIKTLVTGDINQLHPVGEPPAYLTSGKIRYLTKCMRQSENSPICYIADRILEGKEIHKGWYGDLLVIDEDELTDYMLSNSEIVICSKNVTKESINNHIRRNIYNIKSDLPVRGEKIICRKNNWKIEVDGINLANGLIGRVVNQPGVHNFDGKSFKVDFRPNMINGVFKDTICDYKYLIAPPSIKAQIKNDKYSIGEKFDFCNAITTHLSQGSQFGFGIYIEEFLNKDIQRNLNYTGITRFSRGGIYVKRKNKYYSFK